MPNEDRVAFVQQAIDLPAAPGHDRFEAGVDSRERVPENADGQRRKVPAFNERNRLLREPRRCCDIGLAQSPSPTDGTKETPNSHIVHSADRDDDRVSAP